MSFNFFGKLNVFGFNQQTPHSNFEKVDHILQEKASINNKSLYQKTKHIFLKELIPPWTLVTIGYYLYYQYNPLNSSLFFDQHSLDLFEDCADCQPIESSTVFGLTTMGVMFYRLFNPIPISDPNCTVGDVLTSQQIIDYNEYCSQFIAYYNSSTVIESQTRRPLDYNHFKINRENTVNEVALASQTIAMLAKENPNIVNAIDLEIANSEQNGLASTPANMSLAPT